MAVGLPPVKHIEEFDLLSSLSSDTNKLHQIAIGGDLSIYPSYSLLITFFCWVIDFQIHRRDPPSYDVAILYIVW